MSLKKAVMKGAVGVLRAVYAPLKLRRTKNRITIISRQSKEESLDIALLSDYIRKNHADVECLVLVKFIEQGLGNRISYGLNLFSQMWAIAASKVVVLDGYCICASVLRHKEDLKIVQMWHALAAIKQFGYQTLDQNSGHSSQVAEIMCMHRNYDYVIAPSPETGGIFCRGFNTKADRIKLLGLPRVDAIVGTSCSVERDGREIILYAPTFRKGKAVDVDSLKKAIDETKYRLVIKLHPLYDEEGISDNSHSTYEWLSICDRVITDYSALGVEATLVGKPLYFFVYDIDEYREDVGLNVDPSRELPEATAKTAEALAELLDKEYDFDSLARFRNRYISVDTENCTKQLGDFIYELTR